MRFQTRLVLTLAGVIALTTALAFGSASYVVVQSEERQLDEALQAEAREEAAEIAYEGRGRKLRISDRGGPKADDVGRLTKYAALYAADGSVLDRTETFERRAPERKAIASEGGAPFDLRWGKDRLRAVVVPVADSGNVLLLAASREDLEKDTRFLRHVMLATALLSIALTVLVAWRVVRRLTRGHTAIASAVRRVADGDLDARIAPAGGDEEVAQLARDIDDMVRRLATLMDGQRRFVAHAAHELRSPLTALYGELQQALRRSRTEGEYRAAIEESLDATRRLKALADDLLAIARTAAEPREEAFSTVAIREAAASAVSWLGAEAKHREVSIAIDADGAIVHGHPLDLERMLRNLLDNAVRHSPVGGTVRLRARPAGDEVEIVVADDGPGVPPADRERVFEPFFRGAAERRRERGSGLGLAIVREIARGHGGEVCVEGSDGEGARFRVRLPVARDGASDG
ncbi:MAG: HAMP domain-containing histidine kinase [Labilithrix sp.]|nr:HAMP domain-containing histidine kinase [Labilithrix sp.]